MQYEDLEEGCYLVLCTADGVVIDPFLLQIPTQINGKRIYHIEALPKTEEPTPETTEPTAPTEPKPDILQTGASVWPKYILIIVGAAILIFGLADMVGGRKEES